MWPLRSKPLDQNVLRAHARSYPPVWFFVQDEEKGFPILRKARMAPRGAASFGRNGLSDGTMRSKAKEPVTDAR